MSRLKIFISILLILFLNAVMAQKVKTDANIVGHVVANGKHMPFVRIGIKGTTIGTLTDETGHYQLINVPAGDLTVVASAVGFKMQEKSIKAEAGKTSLIYFDLEEDILRIDEVVVSADRSIQKRTEAPVIVNTISPKIISSSQSVTLGESLNFSPGLRLENNCQNCGFTQVRMNGMEGPYSQILINSRPIFSGLAGVYGLELIPTNMIERVEIVRGGGSALYGSNAIAGTINLILKDPVRSTYEVGTDYSLAGVGVKGSAGSVADYSFNMNTSLVSDDHKTGVAVYGFSRDRKLFDANNDGYSEISPMNNLTLGTRLFHRFSYRSKVSVDFFNIKEERNGGNKQDYPLHERDVAEAVEHNMKVGALNYEKFFRDYDLLSVFISGQFLDRYSYYGANHSLSDYGNSVDKTYNVGAQYKAHFKGSSLIAGFERTHGNLKDKKLGYPDYENAVIVDDQIVSVPHTENTLVANQSLTTTGLFSQFEVKLRRTTLAIGGRLDKYKVEDHAKSSDAIKSGNVFSPRVSWMYNVDEEIKARASYSHGYRAPQIFDEDLHIETSGSRQVINVNDPDLKQESSHSLMFSLDYNGVIGSTYTGLLIETFYTRLEDPFVNDIGLPDEEGKVLYTRKNAKDGATVNGINMELKLMPLRQFSFSSGFTLQSSRYDVAQEFGEKRFFRTPNAYGFMAFDWDMVKNLCFSLTANYTGKMLVPYFGTEADPDVGELHESPTFFDIGTKIRYNIKLNGASLQFFGGIKNILNAYQSDFDIGVDRDPAYMYGPVNPRTIYFGVKIGNLLDNN